MTSESVSFLGRVKTRFFTVANLLPSRCDVLCRSTVTISHDILLCSRFHTT